MTRNRGKARSVQHSPTLPTDNDLCSGCGCHVETEPHAHDCPVEAAEQEQKTDQQAAQPAGCLDSEDVLTMRIHWRDIRNRAAAAERFIVKTALRLDSQTPHTTDDRFTREQLRGFVRNVRVLLNVLDARIGAAD